MRSLAMPRLYLRINRIFVGCIVPPTELLLLSDLVFKNFDLGYLTSIVALDFTKAFEIVNNLLLVKLHMCDLSQSTLILFQSL